MNRNAFLGLCAAAVAAVVLAVVAVMQQPRVEAPDVAGEPLFPGLAAKLDTLRTVTVTHADGTFTIDWRDGQWVLRERGNYPVDGEKLGGLVVRMARMVKLEAKTAMENRYERLEVNDPAAEGSRAKQVTLLDGGGQEMASLVVGKRKFTLGSSEGGTYVRVPGDPQTWLVLGELNPGGTAKDWLRREIVDIKDADIRRVTVTHPDGEKIVAGKETPEDSNFAVENLPAGSEPASAFVADEYGRVLSSLLLDDVAPAADVDFPGDGTVTAVFEGRAGFTVTLDMAEADGKTWIRVSGQPPQRSEEPAVEESAENTTAPDAPADWTKAIAALNARTNGWVFNVPAFEVSSLKRRMADLVRKPEEQS